MFEWLMKKHEDNPTWALDVYIKLLAPTGIVINLWMGLWVNAIAILAVASFMIPVRMAFHFKGSKSKKQTAKIAKGFHYWLLEHPEAGVNEGFEEWWKESLE